MEVLTMKEIKDNMFKNEVLESNIPVVVDFWAPWCGPCKMVAPVMEELDTQYNGKVKFVKVDVDENPVTASQYKILSIPTVMVLKEGKVVESIVGFRPKSDFESSINKHI
jgi:thioredoxin 1